MAYEKIHTLIALISPETYANQDPEVQRTIKETLKKGEGYAKAEKAVKDLGKSLTLKPKEFPLFSYDEAKQDALNLWGLKSPIEQHALTYDSPAEGLEPVYFWILDFLYGPYKKVEKLVDNFQSSPGSGHFSETQGKATQMQQEVGRTLGNINTVIKSILNLVYDLKEFRLKLAPYREYKKLTNPQEKFNKLLSLKQVWLDHVDMRRGRGSINALSAGELDFVTLRDAFMAAEDITHIKKLDLNERVKRILIQRADEFFKWIEESHQSLEQRYRLEKNYLNSQHANLKLYMHWMRPYLIAAQKLQKNISGNVSLDPRLVTTFNSTVFELVLLATQDYDLKDDVTSGLLPDNFKDIKTREYKKILIVELDFRSIPQKVSQRGDWAFGGKADIKFTSYALNNEELDVLKTELDKDEMNLVMKLIQDVNEDSLKELEKDIATIMKEDDEKKEDEKKEEYKSEDTNPFSALFKPLFDAFKPKSKEAPKTEDLSKGIIPDNEYEKIARSQAAISARETCFTVFDVYKKSHNMPSHASHFDVQ